MSKFLRAPQKIRRVNRRWRDFVYLGFGITLLVVPMLLIAAKQNRLMSVGYKIMELRRETEALKEEQTQLRGEMAELTRPDRVFKRALAMGLVPVNSQNRYLVRQLEAQKSQTAEKMIAHNNGE